MKDIKKHFPASQEHVYLNTASCGLLSETLVKWRHQNDLNLMQGGSIFRDTHKTHIKEIRQDVAQFFGTTPDTVALIPNFSFGINAIIDSLPINSKVLLLSGDYPSVNWPFEFREFDICYAQIDAYLEQNIETAIAQHQPDIFAFSMVQYISGITMDLPFLKKLKRDHPELLLIGDGTQFLGTTKFDFATSGVDVLAGSCYKWMLSGYGNGVALVQPEAQQKLRPKTVGFNSADAAFSKRDSLAFIGRLEPGHQDTMNYGSLGESVRFMTRLGQKEIENHLNQLSIKAKEAFEALGLLDDMVVKRTGHSTIFNLKGDEVLFQKLKENNIICSLRGNGIRVSFHIYNTITDLDFLISVLKNE